MRGGGGGEAGLGTSRSSPELVLSVSMAAGIGGREGGRHLFVRTPTFTSGLYFTYLNIASICWSSVKAPFSLFVNVQCNPRGL